jgi:cystathionine beta-lyase/cystathionine gamma-synthase
MSDNQSADRAPEERYHARTRMIHGRSKSRRWDYSHHVVPPISSSATYRLDSAARGSQGFFEFANSAADDLTRVPIYIYDRLDEPTRGMLEDNLAAAEGGEMALCFASGMAAISGVLATLTRAKEHIVAHKVMYGCTYSLLTNWMPRYHVGVSLADFTDPQQGADSITPKTRVVYFETPVNPDLTLIDMEAVVEIVRQANRTRDERNRIRTVVDNTFASPWCQRPIEFGVDVVCHSLTKSIGGFGTDIGGVVIGPQTLHDPLILYRKDWGGCLSPRAAWATLVYGLPSLATRMSNYQKSAHHVAKFLAGHPKISEVRYPGLDSFPQFELAKKQMRDTSGNFAPGSMISFTVKDAVGSGAKGERLIDWIAENAYTITLAVSLGQIKTLIECPYSMTHAAIPDAEKRERGMMPGACRLSIGLEDWHDIIADLGDALEAI